jgi:DNA-binding winged helix-turn-helix (wHTH) protein
LTHEVIKLEGDPKMSQAVVGGVLRFERFVLDLTRGCLRVGDVNIELRPKTFEVLRCLAENAGRLVTKDELYEAVWPNVVVSDGSITQCIREIRNKLGDDGHNLVKTVSRRGYLLDAIVLPAAPQPLPDAPLEAPQAQHGSRQPIGAIPVDKLGVLAALAAVLLGTAWWLTYVHGLGSIKLAAQPKLEKAQTEDQFDGIWRVEFANNDFCVERSRVRLWAIRQGILRSGGAGKAGGTVSSTGELSVTWPALIDPTRANVGSAQLQGDRGEGKWDGERKCGGTITLMRVAP